MTWEVEYTDEFEQMAKSFKNLIDKMSKERREKIEERAQEILMGKDRK